MSKTAQKLRSGRFKSVIKINPRFLRKYVRHDIFLDI